MSSLGRPIRGGQSQGQGRTAAAVAAVPAPHLDNHGFSVDVLRLMDGPAKGSLNPTGMRVFVCMCMCM